MTALTQPQVSSWRTDVENAPHDAPIIVPGGVAHWYDGDGAPGWFTTTGEPWPGRRIEWPVNRWLPFPPNDAVARETDDLQGIRPEVAAFALLMERELRANDHKPGCKDDNPIDLCHRVQQEATELRDVIRDNALGTISATALDYRPDEWTLPLGERLASEAADVGNMAMMVADVCGCLPRLPSPRQGVDVPEELRKASEAATPGKLDYIKSRTLIHIETALGAAPIAGMPIASVTHARELDAAFIVACWNFVRALLARSDAVPDAVGETFETIAQWCEETFGPITPERIAERANEEMIELLADPSRVEEAADVVIVLSRYPDLWATVQRKMAVNRQRKWRLMGDGTGYHVKPAALARAETSQGGQD